MKRERFRSTIRILLTLGVFIFLIFLIKKNYSEIKQYNYIFQPWQIAVSFILLLTSTLILPIIWYLITHNLQCNIKFANTLKVRLLSEVGKYIPGRVLGYGYLIIHYKEEGKDRLEVLNASIYELFLSTFSAFLYFTLTMLFTSFQILDAYKTLFVVVSIIGITFMHPWFFQKMSDMFCKLLRRERVKHQISFLRIIGLLFLYLIYWIIFSLAFFFFVRGFKDINISYIGYLSGSFAISTFAGFMAFFLPAGLGAREGLLFYLLGILLGNTLAIVISIGSRIWLILADALLFLAALSSNLYSRRQNRKSEIKVNGGIEYFL